MSESLSSSGNPRLPRTVDCRMTSTPKKDSLANLTARVVILLRVLSLGYFTITVSGQGNNLEKSLCFHTVYPGE